RLGELLRGGVAHLDPFEVEEDEVLVDLSSPLAGAGQQGAVARVVGAGGVDEAGVDDRPVHLLGQRLQFAHGGGEQLGGRAAGGVDLAAVGRLEGGGARGGLVEVAVDLGVIDAGVEVAEVPGDAVGAGGGSGGGFGGHARSVNAGAVGRV